MSDEKTVTPTYKPKTLEQVQREHVEHVLTLFGWNMTRAAQALDLDRRTLYRMLERMKLERPPELAPDQRAKCERCGKEAPATDPPAEPGFVWYCSPECAQPKTNVPPAVARAT